MDRNIESTMKNRHDFLVAKTNKIWQLEKEKGKLRNSLQETRKEIRLGKKQAGRRMPSMEYGTAAGGIGKNIEIAENIEKDIDRIKKEQLELLEKIKSFISI